MQSWISILFRSNEHFFIHRVERPTANNTSDSTHPCFRKSLLILYFKTWWTCCYLCHWQSGHCVSIVETWLCSDVLDNEVLIPNYSNVRLDRNRHGGGGCCYVHSWGSRHSLERGLMGFVCFCTLQILECLIMAIISRHWIWQEVRLVENFFRKLYWSAHTTRFRSTLLNLERIVMTCVTVLQKGCESLLSRKVVLCEWFVFFKSWVNYLHRFSHRIYILLTSRGERSEFLSLQFQAFQQHITNRDFTWAMLLRAAVLNSGRLFAASRRVARLVHFLASASNSSSPFCHH